MERLTESNYRSLAETYSTVYSEDLKSKLNEKHYYTFGNNPLEFRLICTILWRKYAISERLLQKKFSKYYS